ncbi:MAG TPA: hypothetical protein PLQ12_02020, partial [Candidatus Defluviicoccus seviourii]|nr:hypothetical protein [Candidatus Defluviicoccus seviourii]
EHYYLQYLIYLVALRRFPRLERKHGAAAVEAAYRAAASVAGARDGPASPEPVVPLTAGAAPA